MENNSTINISEIKEKIKKFLEILRILYKKINSIFDRRVFIALIFAILSFGIIHIYLQAAKGTVYAGDDFVHYKMSITTMPNYDSNDLFKTSVEYAKLDCASLGGRYFAMFLQSYLGINYNIKNLVKLKTIMHYNALLYFIGMFMLIYSIISNIVLKDKKIIDKILAALSVNLAFIFYYFAYFHTEVFAWFSGAVSYTVPAFLFTISLSLSLFSLRKANKANLIALIVSIPLAMASMGGTLAVVGLAYGICTLLLAYALINRKLTWRFFISLATVYIFGAVNMMQPGNSNRRFIYLQTEDVLIKYTFDVLMNMIRTRLDIILNNWTYIIVFLALAVIASYFIYKNVDINVSYFAIALLTIFLPIATTLPIAVGYGSGQPMFDRINFIIDLSIIITFLSMLILACGAVCYILGSIFSRGIVVNQISVLIILLIVMFFFIQKISLVDSQSLDGFKILDDIQLKKYEKFDEEYTTMFNELYENMGKQWANIHYPKAAPKFVFFIDQYHNEYFGINKITKVYK